MKKPLRLGLVVEGKLTVSALLNNPAIQAHLGPVKARVLRVARRATNYLGAGTPTDRCDAFAHTQLVLIHVPPVSEASEIRQLADADLDHAAKIYVLCETWSGSDALQPLAALGAHVATCVSIPTGGGRWFVLEGMPVAVRCMRSVLEKGPDRVLIVKEGHKELLVAAELLAGVLPVALMAHAEQSLRGGNVSGRHLRALLDGMAQRMLLDAAHMSHSAVRSPLRDCPPMLVRSHLEMLKKRRPALAEFVQEHIAASSLKELLVQSAKLEEDDQAVPVEVEGT